VKPGKFSTLFPPKYDLNGMCATWYFQFSVYS